MSDRGSRFAAAQGGDFCLDGVTTGMAWSVMAEVVARLKTLSADGSASSIDLRGLPMTEADRAQLEELLGRGEVQANLDLAGATEVWETRYHGVWWIRHKGANDQVACEEIAVTPIPDILRSHPDDIRAAAGRLSAELARHKAITNPQPRKPQHDTEAPDVR